MAGPNLARDDAGNVWAVDQSGKPIALIRQAPPPSMQMKPAPPAYPYEGPQAAANLARTNLEVKQSEATASANTEKTKAEAKKAQLDAATAQEQWNINHPGDNPSATLSGPAYMQYLQKTNPGRAAYIQGLAEGRVPFPGAQMMRSAAGQALLTDVMRADPTLDATNYATRAAARKNAATGNLGGSDNNLITAIGHAARLQTLVPSVFGSAITPFNSVANSLDANLFGGKQPEYDQNARLLGSEIGGAYGQGTGGERGKDASDFDRSLATQQKYDNIHGALDLMASKLAANRAQFAYGNGQLGKPDFMLLPEQTRQQLLQLAPDIAAKYFSGIPVMGGGNMPGSPPGATPPSGGSPSPGDGGGTPPVGLLPRADYSGMSGGPGASLATTDQNSKLGAFKQTYRNVADPVMAATLSAFIKKGTDYNTAATYAQSHGFTAPDPKAYAAAVEFARSHHGATNVESDRMVPTTFGERISSSPGAAFVAGSGAGATAGLSDVLGRALAGPQWDANRQALAATNPNADLAGNVLGGTAAMVGGGSLAQGLARAGAKGGAARNLLAFFLRNPVKAAAVGDTGYGTIYGASENPDDPLAGAGLGAVTAPLASLGGSATTKMVGGAVRGVVNPAVDRLTQAGIPLTVGEVLGGGAKKAQDAVTSVFGPGNMVARRYADGRRALNEVGYNTAGSVIGAPINDVGQGAINKLSAAKSSAYSTALDPVSLNLNTPDAISGIGGAVNSAKAIPDVKDARALALSGLKTYIGDAAPNGVMDGRAFQEGYRGLSRLANQPDTQPFGYEIGQSLGQGKQALASTLEAQNPGAYAGFKNANAANRMLNILAKAHNAAKNQIADGGEVLWTPAQLGNASTANATKYGSQIVAAGGNRPFNQLINDSQQVMSSKLPDSGTASRLLGASILTGGAIGGGGLGYGANGTEGAAEGASIPLIASSLMGTRLGQQLMVAALLKRSAAIRGIGKDILDNPRYLAAAGTAAQLPYSTAP